MNASDINVGTKGGGRIMKIKDLIKKLQELDGEKTIGIYDYEEDEEDLDLYQLASSINANARNNYELYNNGLLRYRRKYNLARIKNYNLL